MKQLSAAVSVVLLTHSAVTCCIQPADGGQQYDLEYDGHVEDHDEYDDDDYDEEHDDENDFDPEDSYYDITDMIGFDPYGEDCYDGSFDEEQDVDDDDDDEDDGPLWQWGKHRDTPIKHTPGMKVRAPYPRSLFWAC